MKKAIIITSINEKTKAVQEYESLEGWHVVVVGDRKSRPIRNSQNLTFLSVEQQNSLGFKLTKALPFDHYARKNLGYLYALRMGAEVVYDTDDDNRPYPTWRGMDFECGNLVSGRERFVNVYNYFSDSQVWPRGFPLDLVRGGRRMDIAPVSPLKVGVWQGLADLDPDVDAIFRLVFDGRITFKKKPPIVLPEGSYCPFNSQNTFWAMEAFPLMYLPSTVSFRFTDILRGYVAQRLLWTASMHLGFHEATVFQERNEHDLMRDFKEEIECYLSGPTVVEILDGLSFSAGLGENLESAYAALHRRGLVGDREVKLVDAWLEDWAGVV